MNTYGMQRQTQRRHTETGNAILYITLTKKHTPTHTQMVQLQTTEAQQTHTKTYLSWKHIFCEDFPACMSHQVAVLIPQQSGGKKKKERNRGKINRKREFHNAEPDGQI